MKKLSYIFLALFSLSLITTTTSCREEKSTGEKIEEAVDESSQEGSFGQGNPCSHCWWRRGWG